MTQIAVGHQLWNYQEIGSGARTPILILHGWGRSGNEWIRMAQHLSMWSGRKAYVLDLPGFGGSSLPNVESIEEYAGLVISFCRYLKIKRVILVCHSLGARIGIVWSSGKDRNMIGQMVLVDPAGPKEFSFRRLVLSILAALFGFVSESVRRSLVAPFLDEDYRRTPSLRALYRVIVAKDLQHRLPEIKVPVKLIWGEQDKIVPVRMIKIYRKYLSDVQVRVVWGAGHDPHLTHYEQTRRILQEAVE